jgi:hypothetical protein
LNALDVVISVPIKCKLQLNSARKAVVVGVPVGDNWLNGLIDLALRRRGVSGQLVVGKALILFEKRVLLRCFDVVDDIKQHA